MSIPMISVHEGRCTACNADTMIGENSVCLECVTARITSRREEGCMELTRANLEVIAFACEDEERFILCGLHVTPAGTVATNGHVIARVGPAPQMTIDEHTHALAPCTVPTEAVEHLLKAMPKTVEGKIPTASIDVAKTNADGSFHARTQAGLFSEEIVAQKIDGPFPDHAAVWPKGRPVAEIALAPVYLQRIGAFARKVGIRQLRISVYGPEKATRLTGRTETGQDVEIALMPMRLEPPKGS